MLLFTIISCTALKVQEQNQGTDTSFTNQIDPETGTVPEQSDVNQGAIITSDCLFEDYTYAIDILLSCGDERFDDVLRLHTFKKHSFDHAQIFNDQLLTYRDQQMWFDAYTTPRCIRTNNNKLYLTSDETQCSNFELVNMEQGFAIKEEDTGMCVTLGISSCDDHQFTGGRECGGVDHRYLPITMNDCSQALEFRFATTAESCANEYPDEECF